ncbi:MAG: ABC transporter substrate-binding protein, partial [Peptostreptococcaceae bacterium]
MKKIVKLLSISLCIVMISTYFVGCSKQTTEEINFFNYGENIDEETVKEFEEEFGIKVNVETFDDMEAMYHKLKSGGVKYDVVLVSDTLMPRMINEGLLQEINKNNISNISQMDEAYLNLSMDPNNKYSVPYMFGTVGLIYNKEVVKEEVDSWDILWDEKYKNQIFMFDTYRDTIGAALKK